MHRHPHFACGHLSTTVARVVIGDVRSREGDIRLAEHVAESCVDGSGLVIVDLLEDVPPSEQKVSRIWGETRGNTTKVDRVSYGELPRLRRALKHRLVAEWLEKTAAARIEDVAEILADHYRQALRLAHAAADRDLVQELTPAASRAFVLAGDRALNLDVPRSRELYSETLELWPIGSVPRAWILLKAAEAAEMLGEHEDAAALAREGVGVFHVAEDGYGAGAAMTQLVLALCNLGETTEGRSTIESAIALLEQHQVGSHLVGAYGTLAGRALIEGRNLKSIRWSELEMASARDAGLEDRALSARMHLDVARYGCEEVEALDDLRLVLASMLQRGDPVPPLLYLNLAVLESLASGPPTAIRLMQTGVEHAEKRGQLGIANFGRANCGFLLLEMGQWTEFEPQCEGLLRWAENHDDATLTAYVQELQVGFFMDSGRVTDAARLAAQLLPGVDRLDDVARGPSANLMLAELARIRGDTRRARAPLDRWEEATREETAVRMQALATATRTAVAIGETELASRLSFGVESKIPRNANNIVSAQALMVEANGELPLAATIFDEAGERWRRFGHQVERAHAEFGAGRCLRAMGKSTEGTIRLAEARRLFASMGAFPALEEIDALIAS